MTLHYYRLFNVHVRTGMHLVLVNILICHRGETILVLDIHQGDVIVWVCVYVGGWCWTSYQIFKKGHNLTGLFITFIQASFLSLLLLPGRLLQETLLFNPDWFEQLFAQQVTRFVLLKFSLLNYDLNTVCMIKI